MSTDNMLSVEDYAEDVEHIGSIAYVRERFVSRMHMSFASFIILPQVAACSIACRHRADARKCSAHGAARRHTMLHARGARRGTLF